MLGIRGAMRFRTEMLFRGAMMLGVSAVVAGCGSPLMKRSTDLPPEYVEATQKNYKARFAHSTDNALMHDMVISDIHFVPHTSELSGSGVAKLDRLAPMLDTYGGVLNYDTDMTDKSLTQARIQHVREYLALAGCSMEKVEVKPGLAQGRGVPAERAMQVEQRDMNKKEAGGGAMMGPPPSKG